MGNVISIEVNQPMGTFYVSKLSIEEIERLHDVKRREDKKGVQRALDRNRCKDITNYCEDPDAIFPTPIILSINSNDVENFDKKDGICCFTIKDDAVLSVVDGQHRIKGILDSKVFKNYELPVVFVFDIDIEDEAYIFSTINFNQKKVDKSLIYDLFDVYDTRSPIKTCHEIAKALNDNDDSPLKRRLKVLGKKESALETISQGTFVYHLLPLICPRTEAEQIARDIKNHRKPQEYPNCIFNKYFMQKEDNTIYKILFNYLSGAKETFPNEWGNDKYILTKTTGYGGMMIALKYVFGVCQERKDASLEFFTAVFRVLKDRLEKEKLELKAEFFSSGEKEQKKLAQYIIDSAREDEKVTEYIKIIMEEKKEKENKIANSYN